MKVLNIMAMALIALAISTGAAKALDFAEMGEQVDQWCRSAGDLAVTLAHERDSGVSKREALKIAAAHSTRETKRFGLAILERVYGAPKLSATASRDWARDKCEQNKLATIDVYDDDGNLIK